jgi:hypothetical protein
MNFSSKLFSSSILAIVLTFAVGATARADVVYTYTGNPFTNFGGTDACPSTCAITGSFTVAQALADNLSYDALVANVTPLAFSFTDGVHTLTQASDPAQAFFSIGTNGSGAIDHWDIGILNSDSTGQLAFYDPNQDGFVQDYSQFDPSSYAQNLNDPGTWSASAVPEISTWAMMLIGMGLVGLKLRRGAARPI